VSDTIEAAKGGILMSGQGESMLGGGMGLGAGGVGTGDIYASIGQSPSLAGGGVGQASMPSLFGGPSMGNLGTSSMIGAGGFPPAGGAGSLGLPAGQSVAAMGASALQAGEPSLLRAGAPTGATSSEGLAVEELPQSS